MHARTLSAAWVALAITACGDAPAPGTAEPAATADRAATASPREQDVGAAIRAALGSGWEARYFDASMDLDGDGRNEIVAYVAGPDVCGTGGCSIYVFTPREGAYALVGSVSVAQVPVRVSTNSTNGWRDLVVDIGGGGAKASHAVLKFDGSRYPSNPTVAPAETASSLEGTKVLIPEFQSFTDGKALPE